MIYYIFFIPIFCFVAFMLDHSPNIKHRAIMHKWDELDYIVAKRLDGTESEVVLRPHEIHITKVGS